MLFLFSDTGGGHRSATQAIIEALDHEFPGRYDTKMVDFFRQYYPAPLKYAPEIYQKMSKMPASWALPYDMLDGEHRTSAVNKLAYPVLRSAMKRLLEENPADLIVSVHPLVNTTLVFAMRDNPLPFVTVVTDMVTTHAFWYDRHADLIIVPTEAARQRGIHFGIPAGNLKVIGLPAAEKFLTGMPDRNEWRKKMGWSDKPAVLLVGGGDGMGPLAKVSQAINEAGLDVQVVVIAGRNEELKAQLEAIDWQLEHHIYGFTTEMPQFMHASDVLVTKAGPGTICEGFISGLPLILYSRLPGQEDGNVDYVVQTGAGVWAPKPRDVVTTLKRWEERPELREHAARVSKSLARPHAARDIAHVLAEQVG
jgi:1,2-diacylglycerol 3-beta-galactosyltransferase